jgi:hypothetical protein
VAEVYNWWFCREGIMMVRDGDYVAIFNSIHRVMKAEKLLKARGLPILLIPAPRALRADCGLAIRYAPSDRVAVEGVLVAEALTPEDVYVREGETYRRLESSSGGQNQ